MSKNKKKAKKGTGKPARWFETMGGIIGTLIGALATGVAVYFTSNLWSLLLTLFGLSAGRAIGRTFDSGEN